MPYKPRGSEIYVDIGLLQEEARRIGEVARALLAEEREIFAALESASPQAYDGELRKQVMEIAGEDPRMLRQFAEGLMLQAEELKRVAGAFEMADAMEVRGRLSLAASIYTLAERGYDLAEFPWWLVHRGRPPWMDRAAWDRLSARQREALFAWLEAEWQRFVAGTDTRGFRSQTKLMEAFSVHVFLAGLQEQTRAPWVSDEVWAGLLAEDRADLLARSEWLYKTTPLPALGAWKSAAELAGVTLEQFVMDALHITPYERDTVAGLGLIETRQAGPVAMLLAGQAYYNRLYDEHWGELETAKSTFAGGSLNGVYYGHDWEGYAQAALNDQDNIFSFTAEMWRRSPAEREALLRLVSMSTAAEAAQDASWRMIAGYRLAKEYGLDAVAFFLDDPHSTWWQYHEDLMRQGFVDYSPMANLADRYPVEYRDYKIEQGLSGQQLEAAVAARVDFAVYPDVTTPETLDGAMQLVEKAYEHGNVYEANPDYQKFVENRIVPDKHSLFQAEIEADLDRYEAALTARAKTPEQLAGIPELVDDRRQRLQVVMPRYLHEAYLDAGLDRGRPYWDSLIIVQNAYTHTAFVSFHTPNATEFFPSH